MREGQVKFFNQAKGYGFIKSDGEEIFVHASGLISKNIRQDDNVQFEITEGRKGPTAINVELI